MKVKGYVQIANCNVPRMSTFLGLITFGEEVYCLSPKASLWMC